MSRCKACDAPIKRVAFTPELSDDLCSNCLRAIGDSEHSRYSDYQFGNVPENTGKKCPSSE